MSRWQNTAEFCSSTCFWKICECPYLVFYSRELSIILRTYICGLRVSPYNHLYMFVWVMWLLLLGGGGGVVYQCLVFLFLFTSSIQVGSVSRTIIRRTYFGGLRVRPHNQRHMFCEHHDHYCLLLGGIIVHLCFILVVYVILFHIGSTRVIVMGLGWWHNIPDGIAFHIYIKQTL